MSTVVRRASSPIGGGAVPVGAIDEVQTSDGAGALQAATGITAVGGVLSATTVAATNVQGAIKVTAVGANGPASLHGGVTIDMNNADYTLLAAEYVMQTIVNGTAVAMTAPRTLKLPNATNANTYWKFVWNKGAQNLVVTDVAGGTSVTIATAKGALVGVNAAGAFRMGADVTP